MTDFKVGDMAILVQGSGVWSEKAATYIGQEVIVIGGLEVRTSAHGTYPSPRYRVRAGDGFIMCCLPCCLRKKKPPHYDGHDVTTWGDIHKITGWNPTKEPVHVAR